MAMIFRLFAGSHIHLFTLVHNISPRFHIVFMLDSTLDFLPTSFWLL